MPYIGFLLASAVLLGCGVTQAEHDNLKRRFRALERRVARLEGRTPVPNTKKELPKKSGAKEQRPRAAVRVDGDAHQVFLRAGRRRHPVPGMIPVGRYAIRAVFDEGKPPVQAGEVELQRSKITTIHCSRAKRSCTATQTARSAQSESATKR